MKSEEGRVKRRSSNPRPPPQRHPQITNTLVLLAGVRPVEERCGLLQRVELPELHFGRYASKVGDPRPIDFLQRSVHARTSSHRRG